jgi:hypothetical protein
MSDSSVSETASKSSSGGGTDASRIGEVKQWLAQEFSQAGKEVPDFEYTPRSVAYLRNLATLSQAQTQASKILASDFRLKASEYRSQGLPPRISFLLLLYESMYVCIIRVLYLIYSLWFCSSCKD